jgi:hypothetical protein
MAIHDQNVADKQSQFDADPSRDNAKQLAEARQLAEAKRMRGFSIVIQKC